MKYKFVILLLIPILLAGMIASGNNNLSIQKKNQSQLALAQARHDKKRETQIKNDERHQTMAQLYANSGKQAPSETDSTTKANK